MNAPIDVPQPQPAEPPGRTRPQEPEILPPVIPRPGQPMPEITNPTPGPNEPNPSGPVIVPPGVPFIP